MSWRNRRMWMEDLESRRLLASVNIPQDLTGAAGTQLSVPVLIDTASGIRGAEVSIQFDPLVLSLNSDDILAGSVWNGGDDPQVVANVNPTTGTVQVFVSAAEPLSGISGSLLNFRFELLATATVGASTLVDFVSISLNEGAIAVNPVPVFGPDPTDGRITVVAGPVDPEEPGEADRISGFVYADTNNNNQPDSLEGIPDVTITLIRVGTGVSTQVVTDSNGFYEFTDLVSGAYRIVQTQPSAYLDGGPNELNVQLTEGQRLLNQNFRELGLRPEFVYNRFLTTLVQPVGSPAWITFLRRVQEDASLSSSALVLEASTNLEVNASSTFPVPNTLTLPTPEGESHRELGTEWLALPAAAETPFSSATVVDFSYAAMAYPAPIQDLNRPEEEEELIDLLALDQAFSGQI